MKLKLFYPLFFLIVIVPFFIFSGSRDQASETPDVEKTTSGSVEHAKSPRRMKAPDFTLESLKGREVSLGDFRGSYVLVNMWASWCGPCRKEASSLIKIDQAFPDKQLTVIGVNMTSQELRLADVRRFVTRRHISFPILLDKDGKVMELYHVRGIPTSFLLDPEGRVMKRFRGIVTLDEINEMLNGK